MDGCRQLRLREEEKRAGVGGEPNLPLPHADSMRRSRVGWRHKVSTFLFASSSLSLSLSLPGCLLDIDPLSSSSSARISSQTSIDPGSSAVLSLRVIGGSEVEWSVGSEG
jgi:hypothetical protein